MQSRIQHITMTALIALGLFAGGARAAEPIKLIDKNLDGWVGHFKDDAKMEDVFTVNDEGVLHIKGHPTGYIRTEEDYTNFKLTLEWRFPGKPGNGGVLLRMQEPDKVWPKSIEAQLQSENAGDIWNIDNFKMKVDAERTKGRNTKKIHPSNEKPLGEWNNYEITLDGGNLELKVNGLVQNTATDCEVIPGKICLQSEGAEIEIRNLILTPLGDDAKSLGAGAGDAKSANPNIRVSKLEGLEGWHILGNGNWTLKDGIIDGQQKQDEKSYTHIVSDKSYKDFKASLMFKALEGNSGFYFRVKPDEQGRMHGIQAEIDANNNVGGLYESYGRQWLDLPKPEQVEKYFKKQDWNLMEIEGHGPHIVVHINGQKAGEINDPTIRMEGPFALQIHGGQDVHVQFKDIKVEELGE